jgi:outer membrane protein assembly factor BamB
MIYAGGCKGRLCSAAMLLGLCFAATAAAESPVGWRSDASGCFLDVTPPTRWSPTENVVWKTEMPGRSFGSPVVVGDCIFVVSDPAELLCVAAADGKILWSRTNSASEAIGHDRAQQVLERWNALNDRKNRVRKQYSELKRSKPDAKSEHDELKEQLQDIEAEMRDTMRKNPVPENRGSGNTAATPICDGKHVFAVFGTGIVAAYDMQGERKWIRFVEGATIGFGHASSPVLVDDKLIVHFNDMAALDTETGKTVWRKELPARHATPIVVRVGTTSAIVSPSGHVVRASDGKLLAADPALQVSEGSQIAQQGVVYAQAGKTSAFRLPTGGDLTDLELLWQTNASGGRRTPSPVIHNGLLYGVTTNGILEVLDVESGDIEYRRRLDIGSNIYSSVTAAGDYIYITSTKGTTLVLHAGRKYMVAGQNQLEPMGSNPVFVGKRMYLRGHKHLYCIAQ